MRTIQDIYTQYHIIPSLQKHMYRVTAVSQKITSLFEENELSKSDITTACLLHDMGNILKFNFDIFPQFLEPEGLHYWQRIKDDFLKKYGKDEHKATLQIVQELGMSERIYALVDAFSFSQALENWRSQDLSRMICTYSDMRVEPMGVVLLEERLHEGTRRYHRNKPGVRDEKLFQTMSLALKKIENFLFDGKKMLPSDITDESIQEILEQLPHTKV